MRYSYVMKFVQRTFNVSKTNKDNSIWFLLFTFSQQRTFIFIMKTIFTQALSVQEAFYDMADIKIWNFISDRTFFQDPCT